MLPAPGVRPVRPRPAPPLCPPRSRAQASPGPREARRGPGPREGGARRPAPSRPRGCTIPQPLPLTVSRGPAKSPTPGSPPGRPSPERAAAALSARPGRASAVPSAQRPRASGTLKRQARPPPSSRLLAPSPGSPLPLRPRWGPQPPAPARRRLSLPRRSCQRARPHLGPAHSPPLPQPRPRRAPGFAPPSCLASTAISRPPAPGGHAPRRSHPGCPARCPFALLRTGIPSPSGSDRPSCQARSPGPLSCSVKINSDSRLKPCDVLATTLRICRVVKFLSTPHSRPVRKRPWPGSRDARPSGALSSLARRRGELACEPLSFAVRGRICIKCAFPRSTSDLLNADLRG